MKIAFAAEIDMRRINGVSVSVHNMALALLDLGHDVAILSTKYDATLDANEPLVRDIASQNITAFDVVVLAGCYSPKLWKLAAKCVSNGVPYIITPHGNLARDSWRRAWYKKLLVLPILYFFYFPFSAAIHFLDREEAEGSWRMRQQKKIFVPNVQVATALHRQSRRPVVGFLGRMDVHHKGLDILLDAIELAAAELRAQNFSIELVGQDYRGGLDWILNRMRRLNIDDLVDVLPPKHGQEKNEWLNDISVFVHPSRYEGQPQAVFEAIIGGAFPVISDQCHMRLILDDLDFGIVVEAKPAAVAEALCVAIRDGRQLEEGAVEAFAGKYDREVVAAEFVRQLNEIVTVTANR